MERQVININGSNFWLNLPVVINAISTSEFVSFDLEMTGVRTRADNWTESMVQHLYLQAKAAAQIFNVLQIGISCASYSEGDEAYRVQTFNFDLTPMVADAGANNGSSAGLLLSKRIDRTVSFSSDALLFLESHGFRLEKAFRDGIPYLSRTEARLAQDLYIQSHGNSERNSTEHYNRNLETRANFRMSPWRKEANTVGSTDADNSFNGTSPSKQTGSLSEVTHVGEVQEVAQNKAIKPSEDVVKHTAFRYIIEALVGGDFADEIDPQLICESNAKQAILVEARDSLKAAETKLKDKHQIIVGHNPLFDLCFLYETFIGRLSAEITPFTEKIHSLFPRLVDTKHLTSSQGVGDRNLQKLYQLYKWKQLPHTVPKTNDSFGHDQLLHQAGFDSFMTMVVFLKASAEMSQLEKTLCSKRRDVEAPKVNRPPTVAEAFAKLNPFSPTLGNKIVSKPMLASEEGDGTHGQTTAEISEEKKQKERPIPGWEMEFWGKYGNKIRMGGRDVLDLDEPKAKGENGNGLVG